MVAECLILNGASLTRKKMQQLNRSLILYNSEIFMVIVITLNILVCAASGLKE